MTHTEKTNFTKRTEEKKNEKHTQREIYEKSIPSKGKYEENLWNTYLSKTL